MPRRSERSADLAFVQQRLTSFIAKIDHNFNRQQPAHRPLFLRRQHPVLSAGADGQRRSAARLQHLHSDARAAGLAFLRAHDRVEQGERTALRLEPVRGGILPAGPELSSQFDRTCAARHGGCANGGAADSGLPIISVERHSRSSERPAASRVTASTATIRCIDNFSWKLNKHDVKFGFDFHRTTVQQYFDKYFRGRS